MGTGQRILLEVDDAGVATVTLNRAEKHNALDTAMFDALLDVTSELAADRRVRAVVVHGAGKSFCSGLDISSLGGNGTPIRCWSVTTPIAGIMRSECRSIGGACRRR
ncbi:Enoyl-CoA hydratase/isomerase [Gordonia westfalica]|uniref:Enoyl-CoA hydratase/isomerase n=1 Tax=Gordonia westfalica TaxID=158898 RepID=A0A1H2H527_9ACTN|nr:Enoyl-CoA hydratase/isomerase [Gordonia westfalica]